MLAKSMNIAKNSLKRKNLSVMTSKLLIRLKEKSGNNDKQEVVKWCQDNAKLYEDFLQGLNPDLWEETQGVCKDLEKNALKKLQSIELDLGGGGNYPLLYFFTRYIMLKLL